MTPAQSRHVAAQVQHARAVVNLGTHLRGQLEGVSAWVAWVEVLGPVNAKSPVARASFDKLREQLAPLVAEVERTAAELSEAMAAVESETGGDAQ
jgi:hypothetical protein